MSGENLQNMSKSRGKLYPVWMLRGCHYPNNHPLRVELMKFRINLAPPWHPYHRCLKTLPLPHNRGDFGHPIPQIFSRGCSQVECLTPRKNMQVSSVAAVSSHKSSFFQNVISLLTACCSAVWQTLIPALLSKLQQKGELLIGSMTVGPL